MNNKIDVIVAEGTDGAYYNVKVESVPQKGDLISLCSFLDAADKLQAQHHYEVIAVIHNIRDVTEKVPQSEKGSHSIKILVKPSTSSFFE